MSSRQPFRQRGATVHAHLICLNILSRRIGLWPSRRPKGAAEQSEGKGRHQVLEKNQADWQNEERETPRFAWLLASRKHTLACFLLMSFFQFRSSTVLLFPYLASCPRRRRVSCMKRLVFGEAGAWGQPAALQKDRRGWMGLFLWLGGASIDGQSQPLGIESVVELNG